MNKITNITKTNSFQINNETSTALVEACKYINDGKRLGEESERAYETAKQFVKQTLVKKLGFKQSDAFEPKFKTRNQDDKLVTVENPQHYDASKLEITNENCTATVVLALFIKDCIFQSISKRIHEIYCMTADERQTQLTAEEKGMFSYWNQQHTHVRKKLIGCMKGDSQPRDILSFEDSQMKTLGNMINKIKNRKDVEFAEIDAVIKNLTISRDLMKKRISVPSTKLLEKK